MKFAVRDIFLENQWDILKSYVMTPSIPRPPSSIIMTMLEHLTLFTKDLLGRVALPAEKHWESEKGIFSAQEVLIGCIWVF